MSYSSIPASKRQVGKPIDKDLVDNIHNNFEDLNIRVSSISLSAGSPIFLNSIVEKPKDSLPIGSIVYGSLDSTQFTAETDGGEWVSVNGANVAGSDWATLTGKSVLPDTRGRFIRAKDNGAGNNTAGDLALDTYTADTFLSHVHDMSHGHGNSFGLTGTTAFADQGHSHTMTHEHQWAQHDGSTEKLYSYSSSGAVNAVYNAISIAQGTGATFGVPQLTTSTTAPFYTKGFINAAGTTGAGTIPLTGTNTNTASVGFSGAVTGFAGNVVATGATETAPRYITENAFIKINRAYMTPKPQQFVVRILQQVTLNNILVSPLSQGTSGSFTIDIKKGNTPSTATQSIFQSGNLPTLAWNGTTGVTGLTDSAQNTIAAGQFIVVSITSVQAKMKAVHISLAGDY